VRWPGKYNISKKSNQHFENKVSTIIGVVNLSQNAVLKKILKILQAVNTSRLTNVHIGYLTTPKCLNSQKEQI